VENGDLGERLAPRLYSLNKASINQLLRPSLDEPAVSLPLIIGGLHELASHVEAESVAQRTTGGLTIREVKGDVPARSKF
jgi:hypothetical protein